MPRPLVAAVALAISLTCAGCAASYTPIHPDRIDAYTTSTRREAIDLSYNSSALLSQGGNRRYGKKEANARYRVTALRITNNTTQDLSFNRNLVLISGNHVVTPVSPAAAAADMKQGVLIYLLYVLLNFRVGGTTQTNPYTRQTTTTGGTFIPTGPFIAGGNMLGAANANANLRKNLELYNLQNRIIRPNETVYGLVTLRDMDASELRVQLRDSFSDATTPTTPPAGLN